MFELAIIVAVVTGLVQVAKAAGLPSKFAPILSIVLGLCGGMYAANDIKEIIFIGLAIGLASSGFFDIAKISKNEVAKK